VGRSASGSGSTPTTTATCASRTASTESAPEVDRREFGREQIIERARQGKGLGFTALGVTGGEPFTLDYMPELIATLGSELPTVVLSNATVFNARRLREMEPLADLPVHVQISLDSPDPEDNDEMRGPANFRKVVEAVPKRLCELHRSLGVPDEDHVDHRASGRARCGAGPDRRGPPGGERRIDRHQVNVMLGRPVGRRIDSQQEKSS
jgi:hypothetical protein